jgi:hypothetical protein
MGKVHAADTADRLLRTQEVAAWLAVSRSMLVRWRQSLHGPDVDGLVVVPELVESARATVTRRVCLRQGFNDPWSTTEPCTPDDSEDDYKRSERADASE